MLAALAHVIARHRWKVIAAWIVLTLFGGFAAGQVSKRWYQSFSIPGRSAYETSQRTLKAFGVGVRPPNVVVFHTSGDATKSGAIRAATERVAKASPGALTSSYFSTGSSAFVSHDRHTTFMEVYPPGLSKFSSTSGAKKTQKLAARGLPAGTTVNVTGHDPLEEASANGSSGGPGVLFEAMIGGLGALVILLFVFGTLPAILMPIVVAVAAILNTFTLVWGLTYLTNVSIIVQFLIALVGLGVAIDYALLMIFRFRDELREGEDVETALVETMTHAGRSVIVSGTTVAIGLLSLIVLPLPFIRSMGLGGMLIPLVSVLAAITLLPAMLSVLGDPDQQRPRAAEAVRRQGPSRGRALGPLGAARAPAPLARGRRRDRDRARARRDRHAADPNEAQLKNFPGTGTAIAGRNALAAARDQPGRDEAVQHPGQARRRPAADRGAGARRRGPGRRGRPERLARGTAARSSRRSRRSTARRRGSRA